MATVAAIPTRYAGVEFRSRLEARWAAFFDLLEWKWDYEPIDLDGYIPDFILAFKSPVLVEVKPLIGSTDAWAADSTLSDAKNKIVDAGWRGHALIVGASLDQSRGNDGLTKSGANSVHGGVYLDTINCGSEETPFGFRDCCNGPVDVIRCYGCIRCGAYNGGHMTTAEPGPIIAHWREAGNRVQWRGQKTMATHTSKRSTLRYATTAQPEWPTSDKSDPRNDKVPLVDVASFFASLAMDDD